MMTCLLRRLVPNVQCMQFVDVLSEGVSFGCMYCRQAALADESMTLSGLFHAKQFSSQVHMSISPVVSSFASLFVAKLLRIRVCGLTPGMRVKLELRMRCSVLSWHRFVSSCSHGFLIPFIRVFDGI